MRWQLEMLRTEDNIRFALITYDSFAPALWRGRYGLSGLKCHFRITRIDAQGNEVVIAQSKGV